VSDALWIRILPQDNECGLGVALFLHASVASGGHCHDLCDVRSIPQI
jgi:hypothetical protein